MLLIILLYIESSFLCTDDYHQPSDRCIYPDRLIFTEAGITIIELSKVLRRNKNIKEKKEEKKQGLTRLRSRNGRAREHHNIEKPGF